MARDSAKMRDGGPTIFSSVKLGTGVEEIALAVEIARKHALGV